MHDADGRSYDDEQQRHTLIDRNEPREIEMDYLNGGGCPSPSPLHFDRCKGISGLPTPPMSPSMYILPRCMEQQCYSPVKLMAAPQAKAKRIKFRSDDCESLIEKFDKITIMETRMSATHARNTNNNNGFDDDEEEEEEKVRKHDSLRIKIPTYFRMKGVLFDLSP